MLGSIGLCLCLALRSGQWDGDGWGSIVGVSSSVTRLSIPLTGRIYWRRLRKLGCASRGDAKQQRELRCEAHNEVFGVRPGDTVQRGDRKVPGVPGRLEKCIHADAMRLYPISWPQSRFRIPHCCRLMNLQWVNRWKDDVWHDLRTRKYGP